jgi:hypothetical protein
MEGDDGSHTCLLFRMEVNAVSHDGTEYLDANRPLRLARGGITNYQESGREAERGKSETHLFGAD